MTRVALLGLTGDPVTLGHERLVQTIANWEGFVDEVWLQPCFLHRFGKKPIEPWHRLDMCQLACDNSNPICKALCKVSDFEIKHQLEGGTYNVLNQMKAELPGFKFFPLIGMDNANSIEKWANWERLIAEYSFIVTPRVGVEMKTNWFTKPSHFILANGQYVEISSTLVKEMIHANRCVKSFLSRSVYQYVFERELYT